MTIFAKLAIVLGLVLAVLFGIRQIDQRGYDRAKAEDTAAIEQSKREAANTLLRLTQRAHEAEDALQQFKNTQDLKDAKHAQTNADLSRRLRDAGLAGRLRDPHAARCGPGGGSAPGEAAAASGDRPADAAQAGGLLSVPLTELLQRALRESDAINVAYISCRADSFKVRAPQP